MIEIFNSSFEMSLRILIILNVVNERISLDRIVAMDFIAVYGKEFNVSECNLHGDNEYRFSEYASRRPIMMQAIKELVLRNYIKPICNKRGFNYCISNRGKIFIKSLNDEYANVYKDNLKQVEMRFKGWSDRRLSKFINESAISMFGGDNE